MSTTAPRKARKRAVNKTPEQKREARNARDRARRAAARTEGPEQQERAAPPAAEPEAPELSHPDPSQPEIRHGFPSDEVAALLVLRSFLINQAGPFSGLKAAKAVGFKLPLIVHSAESGSWSLRVKGTAARLQHDAGAAGRVNGTAELTKARYTHAQAVRTLEDRIKSRDITKEAIEHMRQSLAASGQDPTKDKALAHLEQEYVRFCAEADKALADSQETEAAAARAQAYLETVPRPVVYVWDTRDYTTGLFAAIAAAME